MIFAIFSLRDDPDFAIFDVEVGNPPVGKRDEYDCAGVFEVEIGGVSSFYKNILGKYVVCIQGSGELSAQAILSGDLADQLSGNPAPITTLWRPNS